ncbi:MAG: GGDEF domain-containing protein [Polyangiaceae bacterium]
MSSGRPPGWAEMDTGNVQPQPTQAPRELLGGQRVQLLLLSSTNAGQVFTIEPSQIETILGRGRSAHVCIEDVEASREHCKISIRDIEGSKHYVLEDLGSKNGTYLNAEKIDGETELRSGDRVHLGPNLVLRFSLVDETEESLARQLYETSTRDALTRAYNRRYFIERLTSELAFAQRHQTRLSVVLFDIDRFKIVNDTHGHMAGDAVIRGVSACVARLIRTEDVFARYGGEEFVLMVRGISHDNVDLLAGRVRSAIERLSISFAHLELHVTVSIGVASLSEFPTTIATEPMIALSDERLYRAKQGGRNRVVSR